MMRRRYFSALMFTAVLVFASPAGKTMASQVSENQTQSIAENVNVAVPSEAEKQVSGADDAITTVEEVFGERPYYGSGETDGSYVYYSQVFPKDADQDQYLPEEEHVEGDDTYRLVDYEVKEQSLSHRAEFNKALARNAVRSKHVGDMVLEKNFSKMTDAEKRQIADYIKDNARKFRTKMSRKIRANKASRIDIPATIKKSCQTGGVPLRLIHQKPVRQKSNLILILDVSGSCKNASEMMLVFMHAMKEVFPGGCKTYAFTNRLYDISKFFDTDNPNETVKSVLDAIPRSGAYSNYEVPFRTFYNEHMSEVTGDSYIYFIGDARNNKNASGEDYVKAIARKAKKAFWLNTEEVDKWNHGDSIMGVYAKYMTRVAQTVTPAELLGFLEM